jgi:hypothetical protein
MAAREKDMDQLGAAVRDNPEKSRFELSLDGSTAVADYILEDGLMTFTHTEAPPALQGRGAASKLIHGALLAARARGLKVRAACSFVADYLKRHREFADLEG